MHKQNKISLHATVSPHRLTVTKSPPVKVKKATLSGRTTLDDFCANSALAGNASELKATLRNPEIPNYFASAQGKSVAEKLRAGPDMASFAAAVPAGSEKRNAATAAAPAPAPAVAVTAAPAAAPAAAAASSTAASTTTVAAPSGPASSIIVRDALAARVGSADKVWQSAAEILHAAATQQQQQQQQQPQKINPNEKLPPIRPRTES